jgi:hypothetical protein
LRRITAPILSNFSRQAQLAVFDIALISRIVDECINGLEQTEPSVDLAQQ